LPEVEGYTSGTDGTPIYYNVVGQNAAGIPLILCDGLACNLYAWRYVTEHFAPSRKVVRWNYRGHGRSGMPVDLEALSISDLCEDLDAIYRAAEVERAVLVGHSLGVQVILEYFRRRPDRVCALIPVCGSYGRPLDTFHDTSLLKRLLPLTYRLFTTFPGLVGALWRRVLLSNFAYRVAERFEINGRMVRRTDFLPYLEHIARIDVGVFIRLVRYASEHSALDMLSSIEVPTLVVGAERDTFTPLWISERMAELIPSAELLVVPAGTHTAPIELPDLINLRMEKFLKQRVEGARP
jgi:pimeloyl-ACP methyl ester carboxylesterase